ncbi:MAG TPA: DUF1385 domain-containing protein, partial [Solirubrobacteraceae bacterium]|nr:DUF1385 domain-containing protein [Solirubrobacteraceae bacterium]
MAGGLAADGSAVGQPTSTSMASAPPGSPPQAQTAGAAGACALGERPLTSVPARTPASTGLVEGEGGGLSAQRDAPLGGQAVIEGVMMRGVSNWALAVRKPSPQPGAPSVDGSDSHADTLGEIEVTTLPLDSALKRHRLLRLPLVRGVVALGGSMVIGFRALEMSANAQLPAEERAPTPGAQAHEHEAQALDRDHDRKRDGEEGEEEGASEAQEIPKAVWAGTVVLAIALAIVLFFLVPVGITSLIKKQLGSSVLFWLVEGLIRTTLFLGYMLALSRVRDLRRVFEYHGAEHK